MHGDSSLILLPGMGADERMFAPQRSAFSNLRVVKWLTPERLESVNHYAGRLAEVLGDPGDAVIGGASFGGIVALEIAAVLPVKKCLLIGSLRSPDGLRPSYRYLKCLSRLTAFAPICAQASLVMLGSLSGADLKGIVRQLADAGSRFLNWAIRALLSWTPSPGVSRVNIRQIHGARDWLLPARLSQSDLIVPQAGHLLSVTHSQVVNDFIDRELKPSRSIS